MIIIYIMNEDFIKVNRMKDGCHFWHENKNFNS